MPGACHAPLLFVGESMPARRALRLISVNELVAGGAGACMFVFAQIFGLRLKRLLRYGIIGVCIAEFRIPAGRFSAF